MKRPRLIIIVTSCIIVAVLASASAVLFNSLENDRASERTRQIRFMRSSASLVLDDLSSEVFAMYSAFSFDLMRSRDAGQKVSKDTIAGVISQYQSQSRFPRLLQNVICEIKDIGGATLWIWSEAGWQSSDLPDWVPSLVTPGVTDAFSLEQPVLHLPIRDRETQVGDVLGIILRFNARVVLEQVVPTLVKEHFDGTSTTTFYRAELMRLPQTSSSSRVDLSMPLLPWTPVNSWFDYHLSRHKNRSDQDMPFQPIPLERKEDGTGWSLTVTRLPNGLDAEMNSLHWRNVGLALGFFSVLLVGFTGLALLIHQLQQRSVLERTFMGLISHELKTPLAVVRTMADNLAQGLVTDTVRVREYGAILQEEGARLGGMIGNVLALTAAKDGFMPHELTQVDIGKIVRARVARQPASPEAIEVKVDIHPLSVPVLAHQNALSAAVDNLVGNAFKHGIDGPGPHRIIIKVEPMRHHGRKGTQLSIEDNGPGLGLSERSKIGFTFRRGARAEQAQTPGSGIGLSLVRATAKALGGRLEAESHPGKGAQFKLWLPEAKI